MFVSKLIFAAVAATTAIAHPGPDHAVPHAEIQRRNGLAKQCANHAADFNRRRMAKRAMQKRWEGSGHNTTFEITTDAPYYDTIQNDTCVLSPEVTQGPYVWPRSQTLRQDMAEDQAGVPLWLDVGVLDMATCEPLPNVLLDFWHCNATGSYSSFTHLSPNTPFEKLLAELNITNFEIGVTDLHTDDTTFLRGMWPTDENGVMEIKTIFPGFYVERAIHIHVQAHTAWSVRGNGTIVSGNTVSTGQLYFDEALSQKVMSLEPYASHTQINRTTNAQDTIFPEGTDGGFNPVISVVPADGEDISKGMIGYITIGVDTAAIETLEK
ncbi:intradioldioxygenaselike [Aspergillus parasiticus SU-1]|uniref:Intradiol ring-cleavage dioxygenase n=3 Tax=Aspergillus subgen. Circumdati TaxID=2720871 RepID=A0A5N6DWG8_ASPPA|nr:Intradiol ring-cleavage dioxygenase [Aspergillus parasiticus]KAE8318471.1 Intradiol ring-cleavage dioxygenase [Aspergillus transmontanensis]KJK66393.1 intradioldioxygenaselike [Aspergillus parasiticus SU-1]